MGGVDGVMISEQTLENSSPFGFAIYHENHFTSILRKTLTERETICRQS